MKRYRTYYDDEIEDEEGKWVRYEDHALHAERLKAHLEGAYMNHDACLDLLDAERGKVTEVSGKLAALTEVVKSLLDHSDKLAEKLYELSPEALASINKPGINRKACTYGGNPPPQGPQ